MIVTPEQARMHWLPWANYTTGGQIKIYKHIRLFSNYIERCITGSNPSRRLLVEFPPQHGKSEIASKALPTWYVGRYPDHKVAVISHGQHLATKFGAYNREIFSRYAPAVFGHELDMSTRSKEHWQVKGHPRGGIVSVGANGSLLGQTCNGIIFDDPYKNAKDVNSPIIREQIWEMFRTVATTRVTPDTWIIVIHQRFHADDLIGRLKLENKNLPPDEQWEVLTLKAIATEDEYWPDGDLFRKAGEALWPEHKDEKFLDKQRRALGPYYYGCMYQQSPSQYEGTLWGPETFENCSVDGWPNKNFDHLVVAIDPAGGAEVSKGDYPAIVALGTCGDPYLYVDACMERASPTVVCENLCRFIKTLPRRPDVVLIEKTLFADVYANSIARAMLRHDALCPLAPVEHGGVNKFDRIYRLDPLLSQRMFRFIQNRDTSIGIQQMKNFPHRQEHDDFPDALEMCTRGLMYSAEIKGMVA